MPEQKYGKRMCLQCGQTFEASYPAQVSCSAKCAAERRRGQKRQTGARTRARRKKYLLDLLASLDEAWAELEWLNCRYEAQSGRLDKLAMVMTAAHALEIQKLKAELEAMRQAPAEPAPAEEKASASVATAPAPSTAVNIDTSDWDFCKRMSLRARRLPCGEREECEGCERITGTPLVLEPGDKLCKQCKRPFTPKASAQKYCSKQCQNEAAKAKVYGK